MADRQKFLTTTDESEIWDDVEERRALPELLLKADIIKVLEALMQAQSTMMRYYRRSGHARRDHADLFASLLVTVNDYIKDMIHEKKTEPKFRPQEGDEKVEEWLGMLERGEQLNLLEMMECKNYLLRYMHKLGIKDLFLKKGRGWMQELNDEY